MHKINLNCHRQQHQVPWQSLVIFFVLIRTTLLCQSPITLGIKCTINIWLSQRLKNFRRAHLIICYVKHEIYCYLCSKDSRRKWLSTTTLRLLENVVFSSPRTHFLQNILTHSQQQNRILWLKSLAMSTIIIAFN